MEFELSMHTIEEVKSFVKLVNTFESNVYCIQGRYTVDGKSLMGIFTLNLPDGFIVKVENSNDKDIENTEYCKLKALFQ